MNEYHSKHINHHQTDDGLLLALVQKYYNSRDSQSSVLATNVSKCRLEKWEIHLLKCGRYNAADKDNAATG